MIFGGATSSPILSAVCCGALPMASGFNSSSCSISIAQAFRAKQFTQLISRNRFREVMIEACR
jgi:hypothetical protein